MKENENHMQFENQKFSDSGTMVIVDFLYPTSNKNRQPLHRCLLISLLEYVRLNREKNCHKFSTILSIICDVIEDFTFYSEKEKQLRGLNEYFKPHDFRSLCKLAGVEPLEGVKLPDYAWRSYELFCNYTDVAAQVKAMRELICNLIPIVDMKFTELYKEIVSGKSISRIIEDQEKKAERDENIGIVMVNRVKHIADDLFHKTDINKKMTFISAVLTVLDERWLNDEKFNLDFDVELVRARLMRVVEEQDWNCTMSDYDSDFCNRIYWYVMAAASANKIDDAIEVVERLLVESGNVSDLPN
jgi:hypothetical protein